MASGGQNCPAQARAGQERPELSSTEILFFRCRPGMARGGQFRPGMARGGQLGPGDFLTLGVMYF